MYPKDIKRKTLSNGDFLALQQMTPTMVAIVWGNGFDIKESRCFILYDENDKSAKQRAHQKYNILKKKLLTHTLTDLNG